MNIITKITGKCSYFGGANDTGVGYQEDVALVTRDEASLPRWRDLFPQPIDTGRGLARQLRPFANYCAMRWDYSHTPLALLARCIVRVTNSNGDSVWCRPVDFGPAARTNRVIDLSPNAMAVLGLTTDDVVMIEVIA